MKNIWRHNTLLPQVAAENRVLLGEAETPLVRSRSIGAALGLDALYFKLENLNPTGSYKDRFAAVLVSEMNMRGQKVCIATSSGNTGAALSAYCAAAGIRCVIVAVDGAPVQKVRQMQLYGAEVVMVKNFGKDPETTTFVFDQLEALCRLHHLPLPISAYRYCPSAMSGVETIVAEIAEVLPADVQLFVPAGGGGLTLAVCRGAEQVGTGFAVHCVQPEGNDTIVSALRNGDAAAVPVKASTTAVSGLQVASVIDGDAVIGHCRRSGGNGHRVSDEQVFGWQRALAQKEGIFCEPAGAVAVAGLENALRQNEVDKSRPVVCLITGSGFKDMNAVDQRFQLPPTDTMPSHQWIKTIQILFNQDYA
ncbi:MAG: pyridoxal-phosphate dependent enzyme [Dyadobacter sp.]|uniref:pyridoxal-phosphate dependent enzyme n=1 Tax=Dyadobacter sp. TaxID=1914288 RepID=UPI001B070D3F|nr:pyridoxal-phosphate dependent enzyme [Dyadobacter sp.]MBO9611340.1 pyridoxal-phosphate dependent enzyme [Dyadobacter sp.]